MPASHSLPQPTLRRIVYLFALIFLLLMKTASVQAQNPQRAVISRTKPEYPELALRMHISGNVVVLVSVDANGVVKSVHATSGHAFLQGPAEQAVRQWRFSKAPAASDTTVEVQFALNPRS